CDDRDAGRHGGAKTFEHGRRGLRIETRHWLVREDDRRVLRERAGDRDALLLPAGELIRARVRAVQQADRVEAAQRELTIGAGEPPGRAVTSGGYRFVSPVALITAPSLTAVAAIRVCAAAMRWSDRSRSRSRESTRGS